MDFITSVLQFLQHQLTWSSFKAYGAMFFAFMFSFFSFVADLAHPSIPFLVALVSIDFLLAASIALYQGNFTWAGFRHGLCKYVAYALTCIITSLADKGMGVSGWPLNLTVAVSCYAIAGESLSCLKHVDYVFPGMLPSWVIKRLLTIQDEIERNSKPFIYPQHKNTMHTDEEKEGEDHEHR